MNLLILVKDVLNASKCLPLVIGKHVSVEIERKVLLNNQSGVCSCDLLLGDMSVCKGMCSFISPVLSLENIVQFFIRGLAAQCLF